MQITDSPEPRLCSFVAAQFETTGCSLFESSEGIALIKRYP